MEKYLKNFVKTKIFNNKVMQAFERKLLSLNEEEFNRYILNIIKKKSELPSPSDAAKMIMDLDSQLYTFEGHVARRYGNNIHPKHKHIGYHDFFISNVTRGDNVLDIGSSNGELASDIAKKVAPGIVYGIEIEQWHVDEAKRLYKIPNLKISQGDVTKEEDLPQVHINVITLSNVLEHIQNRSELLRKLIQRYKPKRFLIRVPSFQRDWRVPFKKELGLDYRLDNTHFIEYTEEEFRSEMKKVGLKIKSLKSIWGEFWAILEPDTK